MKLNSWDVFDTLIGRLCYKPNKVFDIIEKKTNIRYFSKIRGEMYGSSLDEIYEKVAEKIFIPDIDLIKRMELELEYELSFPIYKYLDAVGKTDILISDMYLSENYIKVLLHKHKRIDNRLIVSAEGKFLGKVWKDSRIKQVIELHTGDNYISDFVNPKKEGINANWISNVGFTKHEEILASLNFDLAALVRAVRLTTQNNTHFLNHLFVDFCLPLGIIICLYIRKLVKIKKIDKIYFLSRDGYWFHKIFHILFPDINIEYKYFSRKLANDNNSSSRFINQINSVPGNKLLVDLQGSGKTVNSLLDKIKDTTYLICFTNKLNIYGSKSNNIPIVNFDDKLPNQNDFGTSIEDCFSAPHGSIAANGSLMGPEYDITHLGQYMKNLQIFNNYFNTYSKYFQITDNYSFDSLLNSIILICNTQLDVANINKYFPHVTKHDNYELQKTIQYYGQERFYIENYGRFMCNGVYLDIGAYEGNNTFFLENKLNWSGILVESCPSRFNQLRAIRTGIICDKLISDKSNETEEVYEERKRGFNIPIVLRVQTISVNDLLKEHNINNIDFMSLSAGRGKSITARKELTILKSIDFGVYKINYILVEHGGGNFSYQNSIHTFLESRGYKIAKRGDFYDEFYLIAN